MKPSSPKSAKLCPIKSKYKIIEHTADIGLKIYGATLEELFLNGALGFFSLITDTRILKKSEAKEEKVSFTLSSENAGDLFLKWLRELLFVFSTQKLILLDFDFRILTEKQLEIEACGRVFDPQHHEQKYEVKAVTYHQFKMEKKKSGWQAEVIFDI
ncbi:MAG: archease [Candidatus Omnitrophica bacterium]|nr:archease [Candidatus Omnitrophota bacterium]